MCMHRKSLKKQGQKLREVRCKTARDTLFPDGVSSASRFLLSHIERFFNCKCILVSQGGRVRAADKTRVLQISMSCNQDLLRVEWS